MKRLWVLLLVLMPSIGYAQLQWPRYPVGFYIMLPFGQTPCKVDFEDFIVFAQAFDSMKDDLDYNSRADTNSDGVVNFEDFIAFAQVYGLSLTTGEKEECRRASRAHIEVSGFVTKAKTPFENVWIDAVRMDSVRTLRWEQTDILGQFKHLGLDRGVYALVPNKAGYVFSPDTLWTSVDNASVVLPSFESVFSFGFVDVQVLRDSQRVSQAEVSFVRNGEIQGVSGLWVGMTDPSGATVVRIPALEGRSDITGVYTAKVTDVITGNVLGTWDNVSIQTDDTRRLILDIGQEAYYIPARQYFYYNDPINTFSKISESGVRIWFKENVSGDDIVDLLTRLGLEDWGDHLYVLRFQKGRLAVLEMMHQLKLSKIVHAVLPELGFEGQKSTVFSGLLQIVFKESVSDDEIALFVEEIGASISNINQNALVTVYELEIHDLLSYDLFEVGNRYHAHPKVRWAKPIFRTPVWID